jgi:hypothetical protein
MSELGWPGGRAMLAEAWGSSEGAFSNTESGFSCLPVTLVFLGIIRRPSVHSIYSINDL